jgi:DNA primase
VVNPWADRLTFTAERTRTRRDHEKYLTLIDAIALLHQRRRPRETVEAADSRTGEAGQFIRVTLDDIALANRIAPELLGRSLDELPPQTRQVYETVKAVVRERMDAEEIEQPLALFSRREIRDRLGWSITQVRAHLEWLRDMEFVAARFGRPGSPFQYELLTDCREPAATDHIGLLDVEKLRVSAKLPSEDIRLRLPTCREKRPPVGGCRNATRQAQTVEEQRFAVNLSACSDRASGAMALAEA